MVTNMNKNTSNRLKGNSKLNKSVIITLFSYITVIVISAIIGIITFKKCEIAPYGKNSILCMDLWGQYFPMYINNKQADGLAGLMYSWNGGFGFNNWVQSAYYCNSVFSLFYKFIPISKMVTATDIFCLIKIVLSSASCLCFLRYKLKSHSPVLIGGAVCYSVCAYMLAFISQPMWTDCLFYAPLVLIGIERLVREKKPVFYSIILAITVMYSFYVGFATCIFSVLYFITSSVQLLDIKKINGRNKIIGGKEFGKSIIRFSVFSIVAGAISAIVIVPVGIAISQTLASEASKPDAFEWYGNITTVLQNMLPGQKLFLAYDGVNLFTGTIIFLGIPLYFFNKKARIIDRLADLFVFAFLLISLNCNYLNYFWHGMHFPNQLPGRWTFLFSLFAILLCCKALFNLDGLTPKRAFAGCVVGISIFYVTVQGLGDTQKYTLPPNSWKIFISIAIIIFIASLLMSFAKRLNEHKEQGMKNSITVELINDVSEAKLELEDTADSNLNITIESDVDKNIFENIGEKVIEADKSKNETNQKILTLENKIKVSQFLRKYIFNQRNISIVLSSAIAILMVFDSGENFMRVAQYEGNNGLQVSDEKGYSDTIEKHSRYGEEWKSGNDDFYRVEPNSGYTFNSSMVGNYHGMSYYSSTMNGRLFEFFKFLGNRVYADKVSTVYKISSPVQNSIFGIKYFLDFDRSLNNAVSDMSLVKSEDKADIYENPTSLSLAYAVSDDILNYEVNDQIRALQNQNDLVNKLCGEEINPYKHIEVSSFESSDVTYEQSEDLNNNFYVNNSGTNQTQFVYTYNIEQDGSYYFESNFRRGKIHITANGIDKTDDAGRGAFGFAGKLVAGDTLRIEVNIENVNVGCFGLELYKLDEEAWNNAYEKLSSHELKIDSFKDTKITGTISLDEPSLVFSTIPQDGGWSVYCDGKKVETKKVAGIILCAEIPAGEHEIVYRYHVPGFTVGVVLCGGALLFIVVWLIHKPITKKFFSKK